MAKPKWKVHINKNTGEIITCNWEIRRADKNDIDELEPYEFNDTLTYNRTYNTPSGILIIWNSEYHKGHELQSLMDLLNKLFSKDQVSALKIKNTKPFKVSGNFKFVKRGTELRIMEVPND